MELTEAQLLQSIWMALRRIEDNLSLPPAPLELPPITVPAPDLTDIVTAVTNLNGTGPTADEIARAIADVLAPQRVDTGAEALGEVARALEKLDFRLKGIGKQAYGGGAVSLSPGQTIEVSNFPTRETGTWAYYAGTSGSVAVNGRVLGITASSAAGGTMTIDGGATITIPASGSIAFAPQGNLASPTVVFTGTDSYVVEVVR